MVPVVGKKACTGKIYRMKRNNGSLQYQRKRRYFYCLELSKGDNNHNHLIDLSQVFCGFWIAIRGHDRTFSAAFGPFRNNIWFWMWTVINRINSSARTSEGSWLIRPTWFFEIIWLWDALKNREKTAPGEFYLLPSHQAIYTAVWSHQINVFFVSVDQKKLSK